MSILLKQVHRKATVKESYKSFKQPTNQSSKTLHWTRKNSEHQKIKENANIARKVDNERNKTENRSFLT